MHNSSTLDMLCRIALDCHYSTGLDPIGSIVAFTDPPVVVFETAHHALSLLKTAFQLPSTHFHQFSASASELLLLLLSCVNNDFGQLNTTQAITHFAEDAGDLLSQPGLSLDVKQVLEQFILSLSYLLGEDAKAAREAQMVHSTLGRSHAVVPNSDSDIVSCSLLLRSLVRVFTGSLTYKLLNHVGGPQSKRVWCWRRKTRRCSVHCTSSIFVLDTYRFLYATLARRSDLRSTGGP